MENIRELNPKIYQVKKMKPQEIFTIGHYILSNLNDDGLDAMSSQFLAECFIHKKQRTLPRELLHYLQQHPEEMQKVSNLSWQLHQAIEKNKKRQTLYSIAASLLILLSVIGWWVTNDANNQDVSPVLSENVFTNPKRMTITQTLPQNDSTHSQKNSTNNAKSLTTKGTRKQKKHKANLNPGNEYLTDYLALKDQFSDPGIRLHYDVAHRPATRSVASPFSRLPLQILAPKVLITRQVGQAIRFEAKLADSLSTLDSLPLLIIQIEDNRRRLVKIITLQIAQKDTQTIAYATWQPTKNGLYHWQIKYKRTTKRGQPTGKIWIGKRSLLRRLYQENPDLGLLPER